jgi:hypothetical protein
MEIDECTTAFCYRCLGFVIICCCTTQHSKFPSFPGPSGRLPCLAFSNRIPCIATFIYLISFNVRQPYSHIRYLHPNLDMLPGDRGDSKNTSQDKSTRMAAISRLGSVECFSVALLFSDNKMHILLWLRTP